MATLKSCKTAAMIASVSLTASGIGVAHSAEVESLAVDAAAGVVNGSLALDEPGLYRFSFDEALSAQLIIDGAVVIEAGQSAGAAILSPGTFSISIGGASATNVALSVQTPSGLTPRALIVQGQVATTATPQSLTMPLRDAASTTAPASGQSSTVAPVSAAAATGLAGEVELQAANNLRGVLRNRVRERALTVALENGEIARATINGELSPYARVGQTVGLEASPPPGMRFVRWAGDITALSDPNSPTTTLTISAEGVNVFAVYEDANSPDSPNPNNPPQGTIAVTVNSGSGDGLYQEGAEVVVRAENPRVGETFAAWTGDVGVLADPTSPVTVLTVPAAGATVTATYAQSPVSAAVFGSSTRVSPRGATISGLVQNPQGQSVSMDVIGPDGSFLATGVETSMDPDTGAFAARLSEDVLPDAGAVSVIVRAQSTSGGAVSGVTSFDVSNRPDDVAQLLSRITYGVTPALLARVRQIGFDAYLNEQLNPQAINDSAFEALNPDSLYDNFNNRGRDRDLRTWSMAYAIYTERQLLEVMTNFWENHFYTSPFKGDSYTAEFDEKVAFRQNALGSFRDLLYISAKSPVMMYYLDNRDSRRGNINENYARELLELHTVGVNSSYTEDDIIEVARILTGWRSRRIDPQPNNADQPVVEFFFDANNHDTGDKTVSFLNTTFQGQSGAAGEQEGNQLLDLLAAHPDTASFVCGKLAQLFVSDRPSPTLVSSCAQRFLATNGNIREVVTLILRSGDFRSAPDNFRSKYKTPLEYIASVIRSFGLSPEPGQFDRSMRDLAGRMVEAGYDPYIFQAPTGLPEASGAWVGAASVVARLRFAVAAVRGNTARLDSNPGAILAAAPARTPEGIAALICAQTMFNQCTGAEFEEMVDAIYGDDDIFNPSGNVERDIYRAMQVAIGSPSFGIQ